MKIEHTEHGVRFLRDGWAPIDVSILFDDPTHGTWLLISTQHDGAEVRVTPAGRKVEAQNVTKLRTHHITDE